MKNFPIRFILVLILSIMSLTMTTANNAEANMFNKFKKGFYFEKYKTAEEAKAALLELHPIGSDVESLVRTLEGAGCKVEMVDKNKLEEAKKINQKIKYSITDIINCETATGFMNWINWRVSAMTIDKTIDYIGVSKEYTGL